MTHHFNIPAMWFCNSFTALGVGRPVCEGFHVFPVTIIVLQGCLQGLCLHQNVHVYITLWLVNSFFGHVWAHFSHCWKHSLKQWFQARPYSFYFFRSPYTAFSCGCTMLDLLQKRNLWIDRIRRLKSAPGAELLIKRYFWPTLDLLLWAKQTEISVLSLHAHHSKKVSSIALPRISFDSSCSKLILE